MTARLTTPRGVLSVREYGATGDGTTDDTAAINVAIGVVAVLGGTILFPSGRYLISGPISLPSGVNLWGEGMDPSHTRGTIFKCTAASAGISIPDGSYGGTTGNFTINGNDVADVDLYVGLTAGRTFQSIQCENSGIGVSIAYAQNNTFINVQTEDNDIGYDLDLGCGGNAFYRCSANDFGNQAIKIHQSAETPTVYAQPEKNKFYSGIFERGKAAATEVLLHEAGNSNCFTQCEFVAGSIAGGTCIRITEDASHLSDNLTLVGGECYFAADGSGSGITMEADYRQLTVVGPFHFRAMQYAFVNLATNVISVVGRITLGSGTTLYSDAAIATSSMSAQSSVVQVLTAPDVARPLLYGAVGGEAGRRFRIGADGQLGWYLPDSYSVDTYLTRHDAGILYTAGQLYALDGVTTKIKAGTPSDADFTTAPHSGTMVVDTFAHKLWVREGTVWKSIDLVTP